MAIHSYAKPSINHVPEYQVSGLPYAKKVTLTGDADLDTLTLPNVSRWVTIYTTADVEIAFSTGGVTGGTGGDEHFLLKANTTSPRLELKCTELCFKGTSGAFVYVVAGLIGVAKEDSYTQTDLSWVTKQA